ncbi:Yos1-like protein [Microstroma glucosiphilum]|uniref:Yos1-like protein n=1 Tax=Pseudomicrostroma glucosiphilum TaxID=1684307 RepID=A0A316UBY7_9BASI|nr:Yos1-like protein [Pseudomicrostroma glucosiphilum]PWN22374.1 Yos1-like protein [Pseudomicrostroma glucosiphilum]
MVFGTILYVSVLCLNAAAILNEERFLSRVGWSPASIQYEQQHSFGGGAPTEPGVKERLVNLIAAVRTLLRVPLCLLNLVIIVYELLRF